MNSLFYISHFSSRNAFSFIYPDWVTTEMFMGRKQLYLEMALGTAPC